MLHWKAAAAVMLLCILDPWKSCSTWRSWHSCGSYGSGCRRAFGHNSNLQFSMLIRSDIAEQEGPSRTCLYMDVDVCVYVCMRVCGGNLCSPGWMSGWLFEWAHMWRDTGQKEKGYSKFKFWKRKYDEIGNTGCTGYTGYGIRDTGWFEASTEGDKWNVEEQRDILAICIWP